MATASSSKTTVDKAPQEDYIWMELKLLQSIVMQSRLGQTMLRLVDNFLWTVEKCAEWSLPRQGGDGDGKDSGKPELVRPLPWLLFLPSLVMLRVIRMTVNIGASILGYSKVTPSGMIKVVQISRRYLNDAMNKGMKERNEIKVTTTSEEKSVTESMDYTVKSKDSASESEEEEETLNEKLDRLALESSEDDEDFDPTKCLSSDANSDEDNEENSDENSDDNVSPNEIRDVIEDAISFNKDLKKIERFLNAEKTYAPKQEFIELDCGKKSSESRDKVEERLATSQYIDSPESYTSDRSSQEGDPTFYSPISSDSDAPKECSMPSASIAEQCVSRKILKTNKFINGEARFISASTTSESKSLRQTNNGAVVEKRSTNVSKCHKGKRTSHGNRKKK